MKQAFCPRCNSTRLETIADGYFRCLDCGYVGTLNGKEIFKK